MKAKIFFFAATASVMMAACSSDETTTEQTMTLNLTTKNVVADTRSAAQDLQLTQFANGQSVRPVSN